MVNIYHTDEGVLWGRLVCIDLGCAILACGGVNAMSLDVGSCSKVARTLTMLGLFFGSSCKHCKATAATAWTAFFKYWPPNLVSMILSTRRLSFRNGPAHSTRLSSTTPTLSSSIARLPDSNSNKTTPKLYTSLLGFKWPVATYSGAA